MGAEGLGGPGPRDGGARAASPLGAWLAERAEEAPDALALAWDGGSFSFSRLAEEVGLRAGALASGALGPTGGRVALLGRTSPELALWTLAAMAAGLWAVPLNFRLAPAELRAQLDDCSPGLALCDPDMLGAAGPGRERALALPEAEAAAGAWAAAGAAAGGGAAAVPADGRAAGLGDVATVLYTSGTTGRPKGVMLTYANHLRSAENCRANLGFSTPDVWGCALPLFHASGLSILMRSLACGAGVRLYGRFDAARLNDDALAGRVTCLSAVTYQVERMLDDLGARLPGASYPKSLRFVLQGGGPLPARDLGRCRAAGMPVVQSFGMTETDSQVAALSPTDAALHPGSSGRALGGVELRAAPLDGRGDEALPAGERGRLLLKSPTLAAGYLGQRERFESRFTEHGWFDTGDVGSIDAGGYLYVDCRRDDLIVSGGENVYPAEVERAVLEHPLVSEALVVGVDDPVWGSVPAAVCVPAGGLPPGDASLPGDEDMLAFCRARIASYKCPRRCVWVARLPRSAGGKLSRPLARELAERG